MAYFNFSDAEPYAIAGGFALNVEEKTCLQASLALKQSEEKLDHISFWGKINGVQKDYYIAQSWVDGEWFKKKYFYSLDLTNWLQLPQIVPEDMPRIEKLNGRFMGEPSFEYPVQEETTTETDEAKIAAAKIPINEEKRLAGVIAMIDYDVQIVPRGAYYRDATHKLHLNKLNNGIESHELGQLSSYMHFRPGFSVDVKTLVEKSDQFQESIDIFEPLTRDEPKGVWSIQVERGGTIALLRSLQWPGYLFFHRPTHGTAPNAQWGAVYQGTGQRNDNIGFMLS